MPTGWIARIDFAQSVGNEQPWRPKHLHEWATLQHRALFRADGQPMIDDDLRKAVLERFPGLVELTSQQLERLLASAQVRRAPGGTILFDAHQPCTGFPLLLDGSVRVTKTAANGREIVLYRVEPGEGCVLSGGCLLGRTEYAAMATAECDVTLLAIPPQTFNDLLLESAPFRKFVFGMYAERLAEMMELVEEVAFRKLDTRLARLLAQRAPVISETQQRLAEELGSVREVVSRMLRAFEQRGWIKIERERVTVLDRKALVELARESA